jgi:nucleoside-diphosphate-sugar epimerase
MARVVVIGATGHVGGYLVPRLVGAGHEVVAVSRGESTPYREDRAWQQVERRQLDREALEIEGRFGAEIAALDGDVVVDLICFTLDSARQLVEAVADDLDLLVHIGTIWTHGHSVAVPTPEDVVKHPFGAYGVAKLEIEQYLLRAARRDGLPATIVHPGHIVGPGWVPLNPAGHFNPETYAGIARGESLSLPNLGLETVHHVHADDVAGVVMATIEHPGAAVGESFHAVSERALSLRGFAEEMFRWFGHEPRLEFLPYEQWAQTEDPEDAAATFEHISRSPSCSMAKAQRLLDFRPRHSSLEGVQESVSWLVENARLTI